MADYEVIPRRSAVRTGPLSPWIVAMVESWRGNITRPHEGPPCHFHGEIVKVSEGISFQGAGFCFADENPLRMFKGSCLFCRNLELYSVIIIEVASTLRRSPSPLMTMGEHGDRRSYRVFFLTGPPKK